MITTMTVTICYLCLTLCTRYTYKIYTYKISITLNKTCFSSSMKTYIFFKHYLLLRVKWTTYLFHTIWSFTDRMTTNLYVYNIAIFQKSLCFYENQPGGCTRPNCSYIHERPRHRLQYHEDMSGSSIIVVFSHFLPMFYNYFKSSRFY